MAKVYLKCIRVGDNEWEGEKDGTSAHVSLDGVGLVEIAVGDVLVWDSYEIKSLFAGLSTEKQQAVLDYDGPEDFGHPEWKNKRT